ncbi:hypothetical protein ABPG75_008264 [Micractinium tetrahymenae]
MAFTWNASLACIEGGAAAAADPAACRFRKLGGGDWQAGSIAVLPGGGVACQAHAVPFGAGGALVGSVTGVGGQHSMQVLCKGQDPGGAVSRRLASYAAFTLSPGWPDCGWNCTQNGLVSIASGAAGRLLCATFQNGNSYYGTTESPGQCRWNENKPGGITSTAGYNCGCQPGPPQLHWKGSKQCATSGAAAVRNPSVCRVKKVGSNDFRLGTYWPWANRCYIPAVPWAPAGASLPSVKGLGGAYQVRLLCNPAPDNRRCASVARTRAGLVQLAQSLVAASPPIIYTNSAGLRVAGILAGLCPPSSWPQTASDAGLFSWIYWTAFGKGQYHLNGQVAAWGDATLATLAAHDVRRWRAPDPGQGGGVAAPGPPPLSTAQPVDLLFYGRPHAAVGMYLGGGSVLAFSPLLPGGPQVLPAGFRPDLDEVRSYVDFLF